MPVMNPDERRELVSTLERWVANANAGLRCTTDVPPGMIALIKRPSDKPDPPGGP